MGQEPGVLIAPVQIERRRHTRYRLEEPLVIHRNDGSSYQATTSEISIGGLSATTTGILRAGEEVRLSPVVGEQVSAIVRRKVGTMYGFEFTSVPRKVEEGIHTLCRRLVPFRGLAEI
jgi:c-di-GMP-binding flagellar brake protein YcgR